MGHYCWMCGRMRPNERFSGKGHRRHLCKECSRRPREEKERIRAVMDIEGFFEQKNISAKNIARLEELCNFPDEGIREMAKLMLEVACVRPRRRKRLGYLRIHRPDLYAQLVEHRFCEAWVEEPEPESVAISDEALDERFKDVWESSPQPDDYELPF